MMTDDVTLGGYFAVHQRPPAFEGMDGAAYSVALYVDETPGPDGRYGGALLFVRWNPAGDQPDGHLETECVSFGSSIPEVEEAMRALTLHQVKDLLDGAILRSRDLPDWT
jgi:hypothetical protein